jgi:hypothetical protein
MCPEEVEARFEAVQGCPLGLMMLITHVLPQAQRREGSRFHVVEDKEVGREEESGMNASGFRV